MSRDLRRKLRAAVDPEDWPAPDREPLLRLMTLFAEQPPPEDPLGLFPEYGSLHRRFLDAVNRGAREAVEESFLTLYCHLHGYEAPYTKEERVTVNRTGGYWCHAGGISPIVKAAPHIRPETVSADYGAGNGLQGLLLQKLYPHRRTVQIEISSRMVEAGRGLQRWLGIEEERVHWVVGNVLDHTPLGMDFIYLYRPVRPEGEGERFYKRFAEALGREPRGVVIFSVADCLRAFLPERFERFYADGHLTCYRNVAGSWTGGTGGQSFATPPSTASGSSGGLEGGTAAPSDTPTSSSGMGSSTPTSSS